ncbi:MAG: hypothetical protein ACRDRQ_11970 [Pseudonocardiaceae bacterium]
MLHGSVPRSILRSLAGSSIEPNYAPDGLTEQTIDDLLDALGCRVAVPDTPTRPVRPVTGVTEVRWEHRRTRQEATAAALLRTGTGTSVDMGEVA